MGYLKSVGTVFIYTSLFLAVITYLPGLPPQAEFSEYSIVLPKDVEHLGLKNRLQGAEELFAGELKGPETFAAYNGEIYTGVQGGYVVKLEENRIVPIVKFGKKCDGIWQEHKCGRPLGLKFNSKGDLFVADAYYGIFQVNVKTKQYKLIVNSSEPIEGKVPKLFNSLDIASNGDIYWSHSNLDFELYDGVYTMLANPSGRLIRYNAATKKNEVLVKNLGFANGVKLSDDESFIIVAESMTSRVTKYNLKGPKAGQQEVFIDGLPGVPDNVDSDGQGGFLVTLLMQVDSQHPLLTQSLVPHPHIRKMLVRLFYLMEAPFKLLQDIYPNSYTERLTHAIGSFETTVMLDTLKTSIVLRIDKGGKIIDALYSNDQKVHSVCHAFIHNNYLWLGSPFAERVMRVPLKQAFPDLVQSQKQTSKIHSQKQVPEPQVTVKKSQNTKTEPKATKPTTAKPPVQTSTPKPTAAPTTQKPTAPPTTQKPPTTTTQKPRTQAPTQKPVPTTPKPEPPKSTAKPTVNVKQIPKAQATTTNTPKPPTTTTAPPPVVKRSTNEIKKDSAQPNKANAATKPQASNIKTEATKKVNKATVNSKPSEPVKQNIPSTQSGKPKVTDKNPPKASSTK